MHLRRLTRPERAELSGISERPHRLIPDKRLFSKRSLPVPPATPPRDPLMADLFWFPFFAKDWLSSPARMAMTPAQRGAYIDLLAFAWGNGDAEPCLDPTPSILAGLSGLGRDWKRLSPLVLAQFEDRGGLLYNAKLSGVWHEQQDKHASAVERGGRGGRARAAKRKQKASKTLAELETAPSKRVDSAYQSESEEKLMAPTEPISILPPSALGVETPRPAERPVDRDTRTGTAEQVGGIAARFMARFGQRPVEAT